MKTTIRPILVALIILAAAHGFAQKSHKPSSSGQAKGNSGKMDTQPTKGRQDKSPMARQENVLRVGGDKQLVFEHDEKQHLRCRILDTHGRPASESYLADPDTLDRVLGAMGRLNHAQQGAVLDEFFKHHPHNNRIRSMRADHDRRGSSGHGAKGFGHPPTTAGGSGVNAPVGHVHQKQGGSSGASAPSGYAHQKQGGSSGASAPSGYAHQKKGGSSGANAPSGYAHQKKGGSSSANAPRSYKPQQEGGSSASAPSGNVQHKEANGSSANSSGNQAAKEKSGSASNSSAKGSSGSSKKSKKDS